MSNLLINISMASQFLNFLDSEREHWTFQTFDDNADRKDKRLTLVLNGPLEEHADTLITLNQKGAGVFVTVNQTDGSGRKKVNITGVNAVWIEDDSGQLQLPLESHITVESSPGKFHNYFLLKDASVNDFHKIQGQLVKKWGSDPNAKDISRVLRLPGFYHQKVDSRKGLTGEPWLVRIVGGACHEG